MRVYSLGVFGTAFFKLMPSLSLFIFFIQDATLLRDADLVCRLLTDHIALTAEVMQLWTALERERPLDP
jgi:hypothetical protein